MSRKILSLILTCTIILTVLPATFAADDTPEIHVVADAGDPKTGEAGDPITFSGSAKYGYPPYTFHWDFGDGTTASGKTVTHIFPATQDGSTRTYTVTLTVTDSEGYTDTDTTTATITTPSYHVIGSIMTDKKLYGQSGIIYITANAINIGGIRSPVHHYTVRIDDYKIAPPPGEIGEIPELPPNPNVVYNIPVPSIRCNDPRVGSGWHLAILTITDPLNPENPEISTYGFYVLAPGEEPPDDLE